MINKLQKIYVLVKGCVLPLMSNLTLAMFNLSGLHGLQFNPFASGHNSASVNGYIH